MTFTINTFPMNPGIIHNLAHQMISIDAVVILHHVVQATTLRHIPVTTIHNQITQSPILNLLAMLT